MTSFFNVSEFYTITIKTWRTSSATIGNMQTREMEHSVEKATAETEEKLFKLFLAQTAKNLLLLFSASGYTTIFSLEVALSGIFRLLLTQEIF